MKIIFLTHTLQTPSTRWRVLQFVPHFQQNGISVDIQPIPSGFLTKLRLMKKLRHYDIVFLQKRLLPLFWLQKIRKAARRLIYEFDDVITVRHEAGETRPSTQREKRFRFVVSNSDAIIATNRFLVSLAQTAGASSQKTWIVGNGIDLSRWAVRRQEASDFVTLGWAGSEGNLSHIEALRPVFKCLAEKHSRVRLKILCTKAADVREIPTIFIPYTQNKEVAEVQTFNVGLCPMTDTLWSRGKFSTKILSYFAVGIPAVVSRISAYEDIVTEGYDGFLVSSEDEWVEKLSFLVASGDTRQRMGLNARQTVEARFSIKALLPQYLKIFEAVSHI